MKQKWIALVLVLLMLPMAVVFADQPGWAKSQMDRYYAVIGGDQSITIGSHVEPGGKGGYCDALYAVELTGEETKAELDKIAVELVETGAEPVWGGSKHCYHGGMYVTDVQYTLRAADREPGCYLYVCYSFGCSGGSYSHLLTPYFECISTMAVRVTDGRGLELEYALLDQEGRRTASFAAGEEAVLDLNGGTRILQLLSDVEHPTEFITGIEADHPKNQAADAFVFDAASLVIEPKYCGSGSVTVTIGDYLGGSRQETVFFRIPCAPGDERTVVLDSTCTEEGLSAIPCHGRGINCETWFDEEILPARGHDVPEVEEVITAPTATQPGLALGTCQVCRLSDAELILAPIFSDVAGDGYYSRPLDYCYDQGWVAGVSADAFAPENTCMRAQVVTFLWRAAGKPEPLGEENPFEDVREEDFYYSAVLWAVENGITTGTDGTHFSPYAVCNRAQVVTFLWRAFGQPESMTEAHPFTDVAPQSWYEQPVLWAVEEGITSGMTADSFAPTVNCNRAQIVTFLYRAYFEDSGV